MPPGARDLRTFRPAGGDAVGVSVVSTNGFDAADSSDITVHSVEAVRVPEWIGNELGLQHDEDVFKSRKVLTSSVETVGILTIDVPLRRMPRLPEADMRPALIFTLQKSFGLHLVHAEATILFFLADEFHAEMLGVSVNHPTILMERMVSMNGRVPVKCSRTFYQADRFRCRRSLERDSMREVVSECALTPNRWSRA